MMRDRIIESTISALKAINAPRFFKSERGYQGIFYCKLYEEFENLGLLTEDQIIEMEYQKSARHKLSQRPDIIFHIPVEHSGADIIENNFAVWALKPRASAAKAQEDFEKLDQMFEVLNYPLGFFVNINTEQHHLKLYNGNFKDRLVGFSVYLQDESPQILQAWFENNEFREQKL
jgi:hypothetical protein